MIRLRFLPYDPHVFARIPVRPLVLISLLGAIGTIVFDVSQVTRASGLSAARCLLQPITGAQSPEALIAGSRAELERAAAANDLPPELLAAVIVNHQRNMSAVRRFTDCFGSALGFDLSIGPAQIRLSTAADLDGTPYSGLSAAQFRRLRSKLLSAATNVDYEAREFRALLERDSRYPGIGADALIRDPFAMALAITEYRVGRRGKPREDSRPRGEAFAALRIIRGETLLQFDREPAEVTAARAAITAYLDDVYCEDLFFGADACADWQRAEGRKDDPQ